MDVEGGPILGPVAGADFLQLNAADAPGRGLADWLSSAIRRAIDEHRLSAGDRLPPSRTLAADLQISRGVVVEAYRRLLEQGLVDPRTGVGTVVADRPGPKPASPQPEQSASSFDPTARLPRPTTAPSDGLLDLSPGLPDVTCFPRAAWLRHERAVLSEASAADLGYGDPLGHPVLRHELSGWLSRTRGLRAEAEEILVVAGVAQSLALLSQVLGRRGVERMAVEDPGSRGAREEVAYWGLQPVGVEVDADGLRTDLLDEADVEVALITPAHHFPTGVVLAPQRRRRLVAWAQTDSARLLIEDDYDAEHRYDRAPVAALQPSAPQQVAHTGSVSKTLAPAMRLGWLVAPSHLRAELTAAKHASDLGSPAVPQLVLARLLASGDLDRHLRAARRRQRQRRDALVEAVRRELPEARVGGVAAGLHLLLTFPDQPDRDDVELARSMSEAGVIVHPLSWHRLTPGPPGLVLGYAARSPEQLRRAAARLADVLALSRG